MDLSGGQSPFANIHFHELGGDHLDRMMSEAANSTGACSFQVSEAVFRSERVVANAAGFVYFVNARTWTLSLFVKRMKYLRKICHAAGKPGLRKTIDVYISRCDDFVDHDGGVGVDANGVHGVAPVQRQHQRQLHAGFDAEQELRDFLPEAADTTFQQEFRYGEWDLEKQHLCELLRSRKFRAIKQQIQDVFDQDLLVDARVKRARSLRSVVVLCMNGFYQVQDREDDVVWSCHDVVDM